MDTLALVGEVARQAAAAPAAEGGAGFQINLFWVIVSAANGAGSSPFGPLPSSGAAPGQASNTFGSAPDALRAPVDAAGVAASAGAAR